MLADRVAERMLKLNNGRMWMAGHMRRGDCRFFLHLRFPVRSCINSCSLGVYDILSRPTLVGHGEHC